MTRSRKCPSKANPFVSLERSITAHGAIAARQSCLGAVRSPRALRQRQMFSSLGATRVQPGHTATSATKLKQQWFAGCREENQPSFQRHIGESSYSKTPLNKPNDRHRRRRAGAGFKLDMAQKLGVKIIDEAELLRLCAT